MRTEIWAGLVVGLMLLGSAPVASAGDADTIQPGDFIDVGCTVSFVLDSDTDDTVYMTTANHCVDEGQRISSDGVEFGTVVYESDELDVALIEVDDEDASKVAAPVRGIPSAPSGFTNAEDTLPGEPLRLSGWGIPYGVTETTRENRGGVLVQDTSQRYFSETVVSFGDSGGPVVHALSGEAVGIVSGIGIVPPSTLAGPSMEGALDDLRANGWGVTLRTV